MMMKFLEKPPHKMSTNVDVDAILMKLMMTIDEMMRIFRIHETIQKDL